MTWQLLIRFTSAGRNLPGERHEVRSDPLRLLPQHEVTGVGKHDQSRVGDRGVQQVCVSTWQQVVALSGQYEMRP
mgnify:CR=1 FL=1